MLNKYTTLLFDVDGTILDFEKSKERAFHEILRENHLQEEKINLACFSKVEAALWAAFEKEEITKDYILSNRFRRYFNEINVTLDCMTFEKSYQERLGRYADKIKDADEVLHELAKNYHMHIITNGVTNTQMTRLEIAGYLSLFDKIFISDAIGFAKPRKEFFDYVLAQTGTKKEEALIIGDTLTSDIVGGVNSGIDTCWFNPTGMQNPYEFEPTFVINNLKALLLMRV